jgi:hypothetical protein
MPGCIRLLPQLSALSSLDELSRVGLPFALGLTFLAVVELVGLSSTDDEGLGGAASLRRSDCGACASC